MIKITLTALALALAALSVPHTAPPAQAAGLDAAGREAAPTEFSARRCRRVPEGMTRRAYQAQLHRAWLERRRRGSKIASRYYTACSSQGPVGTAYELSAAQRRVAKKKPKFSRAHCAKLNQEKARLYGICGY